MKKITKPRESYIVFQCEHCKKKYGIEENAINCEKSHICEHKTPRYEFTTASEDLWWFNVEGIEKSCSECKKSLGELSLEDVSNNQDALEAIYNIIDRWVKGGISDK